MTNAENRRTFMQNMTVSTTHKLKDNFMTHMQSSNQLAINVMPGDAQ